MKTLILMRHTKAAPAEAGEDDFDRHLAERGAQDAAALGDWMRAKSLVPALALVSGAERAHETWEQLGLEADTPVRFRDELYDAVPAGYLQLLARQDCDSVLMIGHNPTIAGLMAHLTRDEPLPEGLEDVPTGATAVISFDAADWESALKEPGKLADWTVPLVLGDTAVQEAEDSGEET